MSKDWTGNKKTTYVTLGASNHTEVEREKDDYYATDPIAGRLLLELEDFNDILEPSCGEGHLSKEFLVKGKSVHSSDLIDRHYGEVKNFFEYTEWNGDIITNPPYKFAKEFIEHSLSIIPTGRKVAMFLKTTFTETKGRKQFFINNPPKTIYVSSTRIPCYLNGKRFILNKKTNKMVKVASAVAYSWFVWHKGFTGTTEMKWFN